MNRPMKPTIISAGGNIHFLVACAPQTGQPDAEEDAFFNVPADKYITIAGEVKGHVDESLTATGAIGEKGLGGL